MSSEPDKKEIEKKAEEKIIAEGTETNKTPVNGEFVDTGAILLARQRLDSGDQPEQAVTPRLFVNREKLEDICVQVIFDPFDGEVLSVTRLGTLNAELLRGLGIAKYTFRFKPVTYEQAMLYKRMSSSYDADLKDTVVNRLNMRVYLLINHLRETDMPDETGQPMKLEIDPKTNGLTPDTLGRLYETVPSLLDVVLMIFEKRLINS